MKNVSSLIEGSGSNADNGAVYLGSRSDDEDSSHTLNKVIQSSGDGPIRSPDVYPSWDPYSKSSSSATILVDVAVEHSYKSYMLPGSIMTPQLKGFQEMIIENFKIELHNVHARLYYSILSLRPGPLIPKRVSPMSNNKAALPSVFVRMNITQSNSSIVNPLIIFQMSQCGRKGILGNITISEQIMFPLYACTSKQVYCFPECRRGAYCDGVSDCPDTKMDETSSCPKCLYKHVDLITYTQVLNEDEELILECHFNNKCENLKQKIQWNFPLQLKSYEKLYNGNSRVDSLPRNLIMNGVYRCSIDGESSATNISVIRKPTVLLTKADAEAETVIISEIEGKDVDYWCNTTEGIAIWLPVNIVGVTINNYNERCSKLSFKAVTKTMTNIYYCQVMWGSQKRKVIKKSVQMIVLCDVNVHFECRLKSEYGSCIPIQQKCDRVRQCADGSDEDDCNFCSKTELSVDVGTNIFTNVGDTVIMKCMTSKETCKPLSWWTKGKIITNEGNMVRFKDSLFIVNLNMDYNGVYQCSDGSNKTMIDVRVYVNDAPKVRVTPSLRDINITYGQSRIVNCFVDYPKNVTYKKRPPFWTKDDQNISHKDIKVISKSQSFSKLSLSNVNFQMTGVYHCEVMWGVSNSKVVRVAMKININPLICEYGEKICDDNKMCLPESSWCDEKIQCQDGSDEKWCDRCKNGFVFVQPSTITVLKGKTVELHCYYDKDCHPTKWRITNGKDLTTSVNGISIGSNKLIIKNVTLESSNIYECYSGSKASQANVTVIQHIEMTLSSSYAFVEYGQDINVKCQSNYGQPQWRRRDLTPLTEIKGAHQSQSNPFTATLIIHSSSYDSKGSYMCFVRLSQSDEDAASSSVFVHIYDLKCPQNYLRCDAKTKCVPSSKLCDLENDCMSGEDESNCSKCQHDLDIKPKELTITRMGYDVFQCIVPNKDCLPIEWNSKSHKPLAGPRFYKYDNFLYILSPLPSDAGEIMCVSGQKSASAMLIVKDLILTFEPNQSNDSIIYMMRGQSRRISCRSNLGKPSWISPVESSASQFGVHYINFKENLSILDIVNVQFGARNRYVCCVLFSREERKISLTIKVL